MSITRSHVLPIRASVSIGGTTASFFGTSTLYGGSDAALTKFQVTFGANNIPQLAFWVSDPDTDVEHGDSVVLTIDIDRNLLEDPADVRLVGSGSYVLFRGTVVDFGPGQSSVGSVQLQVLAEGQLAALNTGTLRLANVLPRSWADLDVNSGIRIQQDDDDDEKAANRAGFSRAQFDAHPLREVVRVLNSFVTDDFASGEDFKTPIGSVLRGTFGDLNTAAAAALAALGIPNGLNLNFDVRSAISQGRRQESLTMVNTIATIFARILSEDWNQNSLLTRLVQMGRSFGFGVFENGSGTALLPWTPFIQSSAIEGVIRGGEYSTFAPKRGPVTATAGTVLVAPGTASSARLNAPSYVLGAYRRPGKPRGLVNVQDAVGWLLHQAVDDGLPGTSATAPVQPGFISLGEDGELEVTAGNTPVGNRLAKFETWSRNWGRTTATVVCPYFRADIAPFNQIEVEVSESLALYSDAPLSGLALGFNWDNAPKVYGSVDSVTISVDCNAGTAATAYNLACVRSSKEQGEIDANITSDGEHPLWDRRWVGIALYEDIFSRDVSPYGTVAG